MSRNYIKAWNNKGKSFDINYARGIGIYSALKYSAQRKVQLAESWKKQWPSLNEMYLSFMDPNGEIINFQFMQEYSRDSFRVVHQMYFKQASEQRLLVFENVDQFIPSSHFHEPDDDNLPVVRNPCKDAFHRDWDLDHKDEESDFQFHISSFGIRFKRVYPVDIFYNFDTVKSDILILKKAGDKAKLAELMVEFCIFMTTIRPSYEVQHLNNIKQFLVMVPIDTAAVFISQIDAFDRRSKEFKYMTQIHVALLKKSKRYKKEFYDPIVAAGAEKLMEQEPRFRRVMPDVFATHSINGPAEYRAKKAIRESDTNTILGVAAKLSDQKEKATSNITWNDDFIKTFGHRTRDDWR